MIGQGLRIAGKAWAVANVAWCVAGLAYLLLVENTNRQAWGWDSWLVSGVFFGLVGMLPAGVLFAIGQHLTDEQLWRSDLHRGTAILHDLRPGHTDSQSATQKLTCRLEVHVVGMATIRGDYTGNIGPLDAPRFVEGAAFVCEVSPRFPERVRVWLHAEPHADELTGRYREFQPVPPGRS